MMMTYSLHDNIDADGAFDHIDHAFSRSEDTGKPANEEFHLLREKLRIPTADSLIERPRISDLLRKSVDQFPATLISGRSGTGKTAIAAGFAANIENVSWYSVEPTDIEWSAFSSYFDASLSKSNAASGNIRVRAQNEKCVLEVGIAQFMEDHFSSVRAEAGTGKSLIVLDDIHHIFDAIWFDDFFTQLLYSLPSDIHVLFLCRSKPVMPLSRLRSKQMLDVIDEKVIAFDANETNSLFDTMGRSSADAKRAHHLCFGRISKLMEFVATH